MSSNSPLFAEKLVSARIVGINGMPRSHTALVVGFTTAVGVVDGMLRTLLYS